MGKGFLKFQKKIRTNTLLMAVVFGVACGLLVASSILLLQKIFATPNLFLCIGCGVGVAVLASGLLYLIKRPTDKRIAKRLDHDLQLHEKVQTMIEFQNEPGDMIALQRMDTERILEETPLKQLKRKHIWRHFIVPVVSCAVFVTAILVPVAGAIQPPADEDGFVFTPWQEQALIDLIEEVNASNMEDSPKRDVVSSLKSLLATLKQANKESVMHTEVVATITEIYDIVEAHNSYDVFGRNMTTSTNTMVAKLGTAITTLDAEAMTQCLTEAAATVTDQTNGVVLASALEAILAQISVEEDDILMQTMTSFITDLKAAQTADHFSLVFQTAGDVFDSALLKQKNNEEVRKDTIFRLMEIFGIADSELPVNVLANLTSGTLDEGEYADKEDDDEQTIHAGGLGSGEMIYGSDDMIYDPELDAYVTYGEVINGYYAIITEQLVDGNVSAELEQVLTDYFAYLFNGTAESENS